MTGAAPVSQLLEIAESVARAAGRLIQDERPARVQVAQTKTSPTDVVTAMDHAAEQLIRGLLAQRRPDDALLGEEFGGSAGRSGLTWVVDPIDGTVNYLYGLPAYAVSIAVVAGDPTQDGAWSPIAGCVHNPATGETWTAGRGQGAYQDGVRLAIGAPPELAQALVATGFGYFAGRRRRQARVLSTLLPRIRDIRRVGCAAMDLCMVAGGRVDAYFERGLHAWDMGAAMLVVTEAGGAVRGLGSAAPGEDMVVAGAEPLVHRLADELLRLAAADDEDPDAP